MQKKSHGFRTLFAASNWYWQNVYLVHYCFQLNFIFYLKVKQGIDKAEQIHNCSEDKSIYFTCNSLSQPQVVIFF